MAKAYIEAVKYQVKIKFQIKGVVDKPDIVGAIFGQSEGLLGEEMDLRELQKNGRIGRIEVISHQEGGNTFGELHVPSSMDMAETSVLAAAIETVDKVGPCEAQFNVEAIEDTRRDKRAEIAKRAKELLNRLKEKQGPQIDDLAEEVRVEARVEKITEYGRERLPAGPEIDSSEEVIVVEGRADVVNLLRCGIKNAIAMGGSHIPQEIIRLSQRKTLTLFADGDRGGELNARKLHQIARIAFVAVAPDGKEVEELQQKEIVQALHRRKPVAEFLEHIGVSARETRQGVRPARVPPSFPRGEARSPREFESEAPPMPMQRPLSTPGMRRPLRGAPGAPGMHHAFGKDVDENPLGLSSGVQPSRLPPAETSEEHAKLIPLLGKVKGKLVALFLDEKGKQLQEVAVREMVAKLKNAKNVHTIVADGIITKRLYDAAEKANVQLIAGVKKGKFDDGKVKVVVI
ncbi:MAG: DNA primase [Candidatus Iainarchaeum archaeon]|uniref:DNA primase DnaG n=1 Tax=Candidatus Iainarchaeum sp. TaxID=3101447 RepID=A0A7T9DJU4_9ARCH|nr:MAG: DNA primase [Candidatus Diapherotrites archaeon]